MKHELIVEHDTGVALPLQVSHADLAHPEVALYTVLQTTQVLITDLSNICLHSLLQVHISRKLMPAQTLGCDHTVTIRFIKPDAWCGCHFTIAAQQAPTWSGGELYILTSVHEPELSTR